MTLTELKSFLDKQLDRYYTAEFIQNDPISIPHKFSLKQDIEIIGFWIAMLSWGRRKTILNKGNELIEIMHGAPYEFVLHHTEADLKRLNQFKHRTFQPIDALYFLSFLKFHYTRHKSMESAFGPGENHSIHNRLIHFHEYFFSLEHAPQRTRKHVSSPARKSSCKRLNMFLRWMVRQDETNVDFGLWHTFNMKDLLIPLDVHVGRVARKLNLLQRKQSDWKAVEELTENLRKLDKNDPVKYDYALFSLGVNH